MPNNNQTSYVCVLERGQSKQLYDFLSEKGWTFDHIPHSDWRARMGNTTVIAYTSGKLVVQGKGTPEFVRYILEPEILKEAHFGYEDVSLQQKYPEMFRQHIGIDEAGKGDYFGPLVIVALYVDSDSAAALARLRVADSKTIKSDKRVASIATQIKDIVPDRFECVVLSPQAYNRTYEKIANVNQLLAWGHARALENLLGKVPACPRAVSDQFARKSVLQNALLSRGRKIQLTQVPRAESDIAVAAASIIARAEFVKRLEELGETIGCTLPKGAGPPVDKVAAQIFQERGEHALTKLAKVHFRTTDKIRSCPRSSASS